METIIHHSLYEQAKKDALYIQLPLCKVLPHMHRLVMPTHYAAHEYPTRC